MFNLSRACLKIQVFLPDLKKGGAPMFDFHKVVFMYVHQFLHNCGQILIIIFLYSSVYSRGGVIVTKSEPVDGISSKLRVIL